jgi:hypothetical protein
MSLKQRALVADKKYEGKYVALASFVDSTVVAFGDDPSEVLAESRKKGAEAPVVVFITKNDTAYIY